MGPKHDGEAPTDYAMACYDAAAVLDQAIAEAGANLTPEAINAAIGALGQIDSPRGTWQLSADTHVAGPEVVPAPGPRWTAPRWPT